MDSGSLLAAFALIISIVIYGLLHSAEVALSRSTFHHGRDIDDQTSIGRFSILQIPSNILPQLLAEIRLGTVVIATSACVALLLRSAPARWELFPLITVGALVVFGLIRIGARRKGITHASQIAKPAILLVLILWWAARPALRLIEHLSKSSIIAGSVSLDAKSGLVNQTTPSQEMLAQLDERERHMVLSILRLERTTVREIMVPRVDILALPVDAPMSDVVDLFLKGGHGRMPVFEESIDHVVGVVYARDLLRLLQTGAVHQSLREIARDPYFVPEYKRVDDLLREFQESRIHIALVVDEYGGTEGLVTLGDLLEEIVGDIQDEFVLGQPEIEMVSEGEAILDALVTLEELNGLFNASFEGVGFATLGGFLYYNLGKIPSPGDEVITDGLRFQVLSTAGRRIRKVRVTRVSGQDQIT